jgi:tellurium resistance protein TerD
MGINLVKGQSEKLNIHVFRVGLGWEPNESMSEYDFDLDVSAFLLGKNQKIINDDYLVFYNSEKRVLPSNVLQLEPENPAKYPPYVDEEGKRHSSHDHWREKTRPVDPDFSVIGSIDDVDGKTSEGGDDETLDIDLSKVSTDVEEIIIVVSIYDYATRKQNFGQVDDSYIRMYKLSTPDIDEYKYELNEDFSACTSVEFCRIYRKNGEWKIQALGISHKGGLEDLVTKYV